jgi:hypothetical protein
MALRLVCADTSLPCSFFHATFIDLCFQPQVKRNSYSPFCVIICIVYIDILFFVPFLVPTWAVPRNSVLLHQRGSGPWMRGSKIQWTSELHLCQQLEEEATSFTRNKLRDTKRLEHKKSYNSWIEIDVNRIRWMRRHEWERSLLMSRGQKTENTPNLTQKESLSSREDSWMCIH